MKRTILPLFAIVSVSFLLASCGETDAPPPQHQRPGFHPPVHETPIEDESPHTGSTDSPHTDGGDTPKPEHQEAGPGSGGDNNPVAPAQPKVGNYEYGKPVPGKPGFVTSPYAPGQGYVDVRGYPSGLPVKDPYTQKTFLVP